MTKNSRYTIAYQSLEIGIHTLTFEINKKFFDSFETSEISNGMCSVDIELEKSNTSIVLGVKIKGEIEVECDRCLDRFYSPIYYEGELLIKVADGVISGEYEIDENNISENDLTSDVMWQNRHDDLIDLTQYIYETICLNLTFHKFHPVDERGISMCNDDMTSRFSLSDTEEEY